MTTEQKKTPETERVFQLPIISQFENWIPKVLHHFNSEMLVSDIPLELKISVIEENKISPLQREDFRNLVHNSNKNFNKGLLKSYAKPSLNSIYLLEDLLKVHRKWRADRGL